MILLVRMVFRMESFKRQKQKEYKRPQMWKLQVFVVFVRYNKWNKLFNSFKLASNSISIPSQLLKSLNPLYEMRMSIYPIENVPWDKHTQQGNCPCLFCLKFELLYHKETAKNITIEGIPNQLLKSLNSLYEMRMCIYPIKNVPWDKHTKQGNGPCLFCLKFELLYHKETTKNITIERIYLYTWCLKENGTHQQLLKLILVQAHLLNFSMK